MTAFMKEVRSLAVDNSLLVLASEGHKPATAYFVCKYFCSDLSLFR